MALTSLGHPDSEKSLMDRSDLQLTQSISKEKKTNDEIRVILWKTLFDFLTEKFFELFSQKRIKMLYLKNNFREGVVVSFVIVLGCIIRMLRSVIKGIDLQKVLLKILLTFLSFVSYLSIIGAKRKDWNLTKNYSSQNCSKFTNWTSSQFWLGIIYNSDIYMEIVRCHFRQNLNLSWRYDSGISKWFC